MWEKLVRGRHCKASQRERQESGVRMKKLDPCPHLGCKLGGKQKHAVPKASLREHGGQEIKGKGLQA